MLTLSTQVVEKTSVLVHKNLPAESYSVDVLKNSADMDPLMISLTVFTLAAFVGYYVVWRVAPALHCPLMAVTNAISSVIIVGALVVAGSEGFDFSKVMGFIAVTLASVNIFGVFIVTNRMLQMFKKKK